jgi:hypothetical protein
MTIEAWRQAEPRIWSIRRTLAEVSFYMDLSSSVLGSADEERLLRKHVDTAFLRLGALHAMLHDEGQRPDPPSISRDTTP